MKARILFVALMMPLVIRAVQPVEETTVDVVDNIYGLEAFLVESQYQYLPISPPSSDVYVDVRKAVIPVIWKKFPKEFTKQMYAEMDATGYPTYRIFCYEDPVTRQTVFLNSCGMEVCRLDPEKGYDPYAWQKAFFHLKSGEVLDDWNRWLYDPAKIAAELVLIPQIFHADYLADRHAQAALEARMIPMNMMRSMSGGTVTNLQMAIDDTTNGIVELELKWWDGFTNKLEIYSSENLLSNDWKVVSDKLTTLGNTNLFWIAPATTNSQGFFRMGDATTDTDFDGLVDAREIVIYNTLPDNPDTDGDGLEDGVEVLDLGTLPLEMDSDNDGLMDGVDSFPTNSGPSISIATPVEAAVLTNTTVQVSGLVAFDGTVSSVLVNSISATVSTNGSGAAFSATIEFENDGAQTIRVLARGEKEGVLLEGAMQRNVTMDAHPPELTWVSIADGTMVTNLYVHLAIQSDDAATVAINGVEAARDGYMNMAWVELQPGSNTVTIASTDAAGRTTTQTLSLLSDVPSGHTEDPPVDADQDGVLDAFDFSPNDASIQSPISVSSHQNGTVVEAASSEWEDIEDARTITIGGETEQDYPVRIHVRSIKGVWGADLYTEAAVDGSGHFSQAVRLFPGLNRITLRQGAEEEKLLVRVRLKTPSLKLTEDLTFMYNNVIWNAILDKMVPLAQGGQIYEPDQEPDPTYPGYHDSHRRIGSLPVGFGYGWYRLPTWVDIMGTIYYEEVYETANSGLFYMGGSHAQDRYQRDWDVSCQGPRQHRIAISIDGRHHRSEFIQRQGVVTQIIDEGSYFDYYGYYQPFGFGFVLHSGELAGGYVVENNYRQLCPQGMPIGIAADGTQFSSLDLSGSNDADPVYLQTGQSAQFNLNGQDCRGVEGFASLVSGLKSYPTDTSTRSVVDALGVFTALDGGHYQVGIKGSKIEKPDGTFYTTTNVPSIDVYVFDPPRLVPDYDRNGAIDPTDRLRAEGGEPFRFWINDDDDDPASEVSGDDVPDGATIRDCDNAIVDGMRDLVDFFPVKIEMDPLLCDTTKFSYHLRNADGALNFAHAYLDADPFLVTDYLFEYDRATEASGAFTHEISSDGVELDNSQFLFRLSASHKAFLLVEGRNEGTVEPLVLEVREKASGKVVATVELNLSIDGVEQMYRHKNLRHVAHDLPEGAQGGLPSWSDAPNWPDRLTNGKNFVFVHGINITDGDDYDWPASMPYRGVVSELFKRFWWAGQQERFCAVQWYGDEGSDGNYYQHVINAFRTAPALKNHVNNELSGRSIIAGHSLGNMVISSAIQDYAMDVDRNFMLNAAVAKEAYDAAAADHDHLIPDAWNDYTNACWSAHYYRLFDATDDRSKLKWEGRFAGVVGNAFNFYSSGDEVFETRDDVGLWDLFVAGAFTDQKFGFGYSWQLSEISKGTDRGINWTPMGTSWAGWEFETTLLGSRKYSAFEANTLTENQLRTEPVFRNNPSSMLQSSISDDDVASLLAKAIPATTRTAGKEVVDSFFPEEQIDMDSNIIKNGWPESRDDTNWRHNDLFEVAYPYVWKLFKRIAEE